MATSATHDVETSAAASEAAWHEPPLGPALLHETAILRQRAQSHRWRVRALALCLGLVVGVRAWLRPPPEEGWVVLRVVESQGREAERARTTRELRDYLVRSVFSRRALWDALKSDPSWAARAAKLNPEDVDEIRDDIGIDIQGNSFIEGRRLDEPPRAVRLKLSWRAADPAEAQRMAELLVRVLMEVETGRSKDIDVEARQSAESALAEAQRRLDSLLEQRRTLKEHTDVSPVPAASLELQIAAAMEQMRRARRIVVRTDLSHGADVDEPWHFHVLDRKAPKPPPSAVARGIFLGAAATGGVYPLLLLLIGAFSARISRAQDAEELGFSVVGIIPGHGSAAPEGDSEPTTDHA